MADDADDADGEDAELARQLATRAMSLVRAGAEPDAAVAVLLGFAHGRPRAVELARARCAAAVDQNPRDRAATDAVALLEDTLAQLR